MICGKCSECLSISGFGCTIRYRARWLYSGPVHVGAGEAAVVIELGQRNPSLAPLAPDESLGGLALRIERVEFLFEPFFGRFARVDRAAQASRRWLRNFGPIPENSERWLWL